jgi:hypothetical protein
LYFFSSWYWVWTQGLHFEPLHQPFFCDGVFRDRVYWTICLGWLWTAVLLIAASLVARITGMSSWCLAALLNSIFYRVLP